MLWSWFFFSFWWRGMGFYMQWGKINDMHLSYAHDISHQLHILNCLWNTAGASPTFCRLVHHACCTWMQGDMQCSLTCRRECVQGTTTAVADPCVAVCMPFEGYLTMQRWHAPAIIRESALLVCLFVFPCCCQGLAMWMQCRFHHSMSDELTICCFKNQKALYDTSKQCQLADNSPQSGCAWLQYPFQRCVLSDCCISEMNELHSSASTETLCIASFPWKTIKFHALELYWPFWCNALIDVWICLDL